MSRITKGLGAMLLAGVLSACAGGPSVGPGYIAGSYHPSVLNYIAGKGGMPTEVIGNPFAAPREELEAVVMETMARSHFGPHFPFFTKAPEGFVSPYRVVVAFDPAPGTSIYALCAGGVQTRARAPSAPNRVMAALCARDLVVTTVSGSIAGPSGPRDPGLVALLGQMSHALFPPFDPNRGGGFDEFMTSAM